MLLDELGAFIGSKALATVGVDLLLGGLKPDPAECCALVEYSGEPPLRNQNEGAARSGAQSAERPRVQLLCRSTSYETGRSLIGTITTALDGIVNQSLSGVWYLRVSALQSPFFIEEDDNGRQIFGCNFQVTKGV